MTTQRDALIRAAMFCGLVTVSTTPAFAQVPAPPAQTINVVVGDTVWVTTADGSITKGRVAALSAGTLELSARRKPVIFKVTDIQQIETKYDDDVQNGVVKGLVAGGVVGGLTGFAFAGDCGNCHGAGTAVITAAVEFGVVGAIIGAFVDNNVDAKRMVYSAAPPKVVFQVAPLRRGAGARVAIRW